MIAKVNFFLCLFFTAFSLTATTQNGERKIVVLIPSYNNKAWYKGNLDSVFSQQYSNYHVMYIDDCSPDGTAQLVQEYIQERGCHDKITLIANTERRLKMANVYNAVHACDDHDIMLELDGDDKLMGDQVFACINKVYADGDVWMTYGSYVHSNGSPQVVGKAYPEAIIKNNAYREYEWIGKHLRTYYAALFKKIARKDLQYEGDFFAVTCDLAFTYPMLEMAAHHAKFIPHALYIYNVHNPISDCVLQERYQLSLDRYIRNCKRYQPLNTLF